MFIHKFLNRSQLMILKKKMYESFENNLYWEDPNFQNEIKTLMDEIIIWCNLVTQSNGIYNTKFAGCVINQLDTEIGYVNINEQTVQNEKMTINDFKDKFWNDLEESSKIQRYEITKEIHEKFEQRFEFCDQINDTKGFATDKFVDCVINETDARIDDLKSDRLSVDLQIMQVLQQENLNYSQKLLEEQEKSSIFAILSVILAVISVVSSYLFFREKAKRK